MYADVTLREKKSPVIWAQSLDMTGFFAGGGRGLRKCKKNTQEQYEILKFDPAKTLINQGFSAEKTARANAHFESAPL